MKRLLKLQREKSKSFLKHMTAFATVKRGNIAILTAFLFVPLCVLLGSGVDLARWARAQMQLQAAVDSGVLAAASVRNTASMEDAGKDYVLSNLPNVPPWNKLSGKDVEILESDEDGSTRRVSIRAQVDIPTFFLPLINIDNLVVSAEAEAQQKVFKTEIALVLDSSNSMEDKGKMDALKVAATEFIDTIYSSEFPELNSVSLVPFAGSVNILPYFAQFAIPKITAVLDPSKNQYKINKDIPKGNFRFTKGTHCIELIPGVDYSDKNIPDNSRSEIPYFWVAVSENIWCPPDSTSVFLNSKNSKVIKTRIEAMDFAFGTGIDVAIAFAQKTLSPDLRGKLGGDFDDRPASYDDADTRKYMILMTDGDITAQTRPLDITNRNAYTRNQQVIYRSADAYKYMLDQCDQLKNNGVTIYTIGFDIIPKSTIENKLRQCASRNTNYFPANTGNINQTFKDIAAQIGDLYISG